MGPHEPLPQARSAKDMEIDNDQHRDRRVAQ